MTEQTHIFYNYLMKLDLRTNELFTVLTYLYVIKELNRIGKIPLNIDIPTVE